MCGMTARDLIKALEVCDLDKEVSVIISISKDEESYVIMARPIHEVVEREEMIGIN